MAVRYSGSKNRHWYACTGASAEYAEPLCQSAPGPVLDELVASQIHAAVAPSALEASLAAVAEVEREAAALARQWQLRRERSRYEAERAARQYEACEPENRLVARELERRWEEALKEQRQLEDDYARWRRSAPTRLTDDDERAIRSLAADIPAVWGADSTTPADRQRIARLLLEQVTVIADRSSEKVDVQLHWFGGLVRSHVISRPVTRYDLLSDYPRLIERLREMAGAGLIAAEIARRLNAEGFRPPRRAERFTTDMVLRLAARLRIPRHTRYGSPAGLGPNEFRPMTLARRLSVSRDTIRRWLEYGWLSARLDADGHNVIWANAAELKRLRGLQRALRDGVTGSRLEKLKKPKPRPAK
jgi:hypothetical protein